MYDDLFNKLKKTNEFITKEQIYALYDQVSKEIESGKKDNGVWTKAYADARGDLQATKGIYIELMVERYILAEDARMEKAKHDTLALQKKKRSEETKRQFEKIGTSLSKLGDWFDDFCNMLAKIFWKILKYGFFLLIGLVLVVIIIEYLK